MTVIQLRIDELSEQQLDALVARADGCAEGVEIPYSTDWQWGGQIIERERISIDTWQGDWAAQYDTPVKHPADEKRSPSHHRHRGPTPLVAAMRCYVRSRFGDTVELPV